MPVIAVLVNHDELYQKMIDKGINPIIVNDLPCTTEEDKEKIRELTLNRLSSDTLSIIPTCGGTCRATTARNMLGRICPRCGNEVRSPMGDVSKSLLWMRAPQGVDKLVNLLAWKMLSTYFTKGGYDALCYLTDSAYNPGTARIPIEIDKLAARGHQRDLNYFVANFDQILSDLMMIYPEKPNKPYSELYAWIDDHRDRIFTKFQEIPSKSTFIADQTIVGQYMEETIQEQIDTIYHVVSIDRDFYDKNPRVISNRTARVLSRQAEFYNNYTITNYQPKPGHYRRQMYGTRTPWAARGVISSVTGHHDSDDVEIPWRIAVPMFQHHLMGKLMRAGDLVNDAYGKILGHVAVYNEQIHKFLDEIFGEFPGGRGPAMILHRN